MMVRRVGKYLLGLFIISIGINFSIITNWGVSAVNSVPYSISAVTNQPFSICVMVVYLVYIFLQYLILKKDFKWTHFAQLLCVTVFGQFIAFTGDLISSYIVADTVILKTVFMFSSIGLVALGISMYMQANLVLLPVEGLSYAISQKSNKYTFATVKTALDILFVIFSVSVGLCFKGELAGIGIGTVVSAFLTGRLIPYTNKIADLI